MKSSILWVAPAAALAVPLLAQAQSGRAEPTATKPPAAQLRCQSAFADYKAWQDIKPGDWRSLNDNVRDAASAGAGHAGHTTAAPPPKASAPAVPGHGGPHKHGSKP